MSHLWKVNSGLFRIRQHVLISPVLFSRITRLCLKGYDRPAQRILSCRNFREAQDIEFLFLFKTILEWS